jgi:hypothetical protein
MPRQPRRHPISRAAARDLKGDRGMDEDQFKTLRRRLLYPGGTRSRLLSLSAVLARTRTILLAALIAAAALLPHAPFVAAKTVRDGNCGLTASGTTVLGSKAYSQSFTASHTGQLISGFVETYNVQSASATYTVELWDAASGLPIGTAPLASTTVVHPRSGYEFDYPVFETPAKVKSGHTYALVMTVPDPSINGVVAVPVDACETFALSNGGPFQYDSDNRDLRFSVSVKVKRHHHH